MAIIVLLICVSIFAYCHCTDDPEKHYMYLMSIYEDQKKEHGGKENDNI